MKPAKTFATTISAAVAGATVGYVAGVLTAPAKGTETRHRISQKVEAGAEDLTRGAHQRMRDAKDAASCALVAGEEKVSRAVTAFRTKAANAVGGRG